MAHFSAKNIKTSVPPMITGKILLSLSTGALYTNDANAKNFISSNFYLYWIILWYATVERFTWRSDLTQLFCEENLLPFYIIYLTQKLLYREFLWWMSKWFFSVLLWAIKNSFFGIPLSIVTVVTIILVILIILSSLGIVLSILITMM